MFLRFCVSYHDAQKVFVHLCDQGPLLKKAQLNKERIREVLDDMIQAKDQLLFCLSFLCCVTVNFHVY